MHWQRGADPGSIRVFAPAKLNLTLEVGPPREDGYHPIASVMVPLSLADEITVYHRDDDTLHLNVSMADAQGVPLAADQGNLALRAGLLLQQYAESERGIRKGGSIRLHKRIPVAAGLGGGSADAAAVLVGLNQLWELNLHTTELARLGEELGADVPFCIRSKAGLVEGIGEQYTPLAGVPRIPVVLINPRRPLSTGQVFSRFDAGCEPGLPGERTMHMMRALFSGELRNVAKAVYNDLEEPARHLLPEIAAMQSLLTDAGALTAHVTGSGPTVFGIVESESHAKQVCEACQTQRSGQSADWWVWWGWAGAVDTPDLSTGRTELSAATCKG